MAKDRTLRDRVESLELDIVSLRSDASGARHRITALEDARKAADEAIQAVRNRLYALDQAQRPAEKPATENRCNICHGNGVYESPLPCRNEIECPNCGPSVSRQPPAPAPSEESRLRDAVVDAALAWHDPGPSIKSGVDVTVRLGAACRALRAHRAKKGGA